MDGPSGVLVVDKPSGPTSHDIVDRARRALGTRRVGHTGTLDPFASGVLPLCVGKATRLARFLGGGPKEYAARVRLGFATDTDDLSGAPLGPEQGVELPLERVRAACGALVGELEQLPPRYSAKSVGGLRLYELARRGQETPRQPSRVTVHALELVAYVPPHVDLTITCSAGTYVRALARDLGAALGVGGHLSALRRTRSGEFGLGEAVPGDCLEGVLARLIPLSALLPALPWASLDARGVEAVRHGRLIPKAFIAKDFAGTAGGPLRLLGEDGRLLGLARRVAGLGPRDEGALQPEVVLVD